MAAELAGGPIMKNKSSRKLKFPGMPDRQYQEYREQLRQTDRLGVIPGPPTFRNAGDTQPGWYSQ